MHRASAMLHINYIKVTGSEAGATIGFLLVILILCISALLLVVGKGNGPVIMGWVLLVVGVFLGIRILRVILSPGESEIRVITDEERITIHLPGRGTNVIPIVRISSIIGIAHEWGRTDGGDEVDFEIYWDSKKLRITEEVLRESGLRKLLCELPQFNHNLLQEAQLAALHGNVPFWGKRFTLLENAEAKT
jgi:hypothetical protein